MSALVAGLVRLPWDIPFGGSVTMLHGPLMVSGFLGTVIAVERAAALGRPVAWLAPLLNGVGVFVLLLHTQLREGLAFNAQQAGALLFTAGGIGLVAIFAHVLRRHASRPLVVMAMGAVSYVVANLVLLFDRPVSVAVPFWSAFLVLTIAGERLELSRFLAPPRSARVLFLLPTAAIVVGAVAVWGSGALADRIQGAGFVALAAWLLRYDIATRTVRSRGVTRYTAGCLLAGYVWLAAAGVQLVANPGAIAGYHYDASLHALYVGFVLSMVFGHAPIIVPALVGRNVTFGARFYAPLVVLHASLLLRVGSDHAEWADGRRWGGLVNEVAIVLFVAVLLSSLRHRSGDGGTPTPSAPRAA